MMETNITRLDLDRAYRAGQQSQQARIDELEKMIGEALKYCECYFGDFYNDGVCKDIHNILRGEK